LLQELALADRFVFDKTGTLTRGRPSIAQVRIAPGHEEKRALAIACCLERDSEHPLARAFFAADARGSRAEQWVAQSVRVVAGFGIDGVIDGKRHRIGQPDWAAKLFEAGSERAGDAARSMSEGKGAGRGESLIGVLLADEGGPIAWFGVEDAIREEAATVLAQLARRGLALEMSSGDPSPAAREVAVALGLEVDSIGATPEAKVARVRALQSEGERVVVVGDGVNDAPLLRAGDASIAMGSGCDLSRLGADAVLMQDDLTLLPRAVDGARRLRRIMRQNFTWAIAYNLVALPLAVSGQLSPWLAALGMSTSSLVVVLNALRLNRLPESA
jgi:Cu2+-exporting ATPase